MESGLYAACSALIARTQALDMLANNLANVDTTGFKQSSQFYEAVNSAMNKQSEGALNNAINQFGIVASNNVDLSNGSREATGNALDLAIDGPGFFNVKSPAGTVYTRAGNLQVSPTGTLLTSAGDPVIGTDGNPIVLPTGEVTIGGGGDVSVNGSLVGTIALTEFPQGTPLTSVGNTYFSAPAGTATTATKSTIVSGSLESSNVNAIEAQVDLISLQRHSELLERAMKIFNTDFDQSAAVDLPKV